MNPKAIIKPIQKDTVEAYLQVNKQSWLDAYINEDLGITKEVISEFCDKLASPERIAKFKEAIDLGKVDSIYFMELENKVIGCLQFFVRDHIGIIRILYVAPEYIGKGYGRQLMEFALTSFKAEGINKVELEVVDYNKRAIDFYQKAGFKNTGKAGKVFELTEDLVMKTVIMEKIL